MKPKKNAQENTAGRTCPECGGGDLIRGTRTTTVQYGGLESEPFEQPGLWCQACGEGLLSFKDMEVGTRRMHVLKAQAEHLLLPSEVRHVRQKLGLSQREAGRMLGGGPNAFQKYESADVLPSQAISNLLRVLARDPSGLEALRSEGDRQGASATTSSASVSYQAE